MHSMLSIISFSFLYYADFNIDIYIYTWYKRLYVRFIHLYVAVMHVEHYKAHAI